MTKIEKFVIILISIPLFGIRKFYVGGAHMSNLQTSINRDIDIWDNAVKVAGGNKTLAKENLTEAIFDFARIISKRVFQNGFKVNPEYAVVENLDVNRFESERIAIMTQTRNCFAINKKGDIYSITESNKYGFKKVSKEDILNLQGEQIGFLHRTIYLLREEVVKSNKK